MSEYILCEGNVSKRLKDVSNFDSLMEGISGPGFRDELVCFVQVVCGYEQEHLRAIMDATHGEGTLDKFVGESYVDAMATDSVKVFDMLKSELGDEESARDFLLERGALYYAHYAKCNHNYFDRVLGYDKVDTTLSLLKNRFTYKVPVLSGKTSKGFNVLLTSFKDYRESFVNTLLDWNDKGKIKLDQSCVVCYPDGDSDYQRGNEWLMRVELVDDKVQVFFMPYSGKEECTKSSAFTKELYMMVDNGKV